MKIGYLGPVGSYSYEAASKYKREDDEIIEYLTITQTIEALENNVLDMSIVPFENAIYGSVVDTMDAILKFKDIYINDEIIIDINHKLMCKNKDREITKIYSHPQALAQCQEFLDEKYASVERIPVSSTSYAAKLVTEDENAACICNSACKELYNLEILNENIQEISKNQTKFIVISKKEKINLNSTKTSLVFSTKDKPGALYKILGLFSISDINLTKIESRPARTKLGDYLFFVDIEGSKEDKNIKKVLNFVKDYCEEFRILGSY